jgi:hypothetical protein
MCMVVLLVAACVRELSSSRLLLFTNCCRWPTPYHLGPLIVPRWYFQMILGKRRCSANYTEVYCQPTKDHRGAPTSHRSTIRVPKLPTPPFNFQYHCKS